MIEAEQYLLCESLIALSTVDGFRFRPRTTKRMWILVKTFGSVSARSEVSCTSQPETLCPLFFRISTTSYAVQLPVPVSIFAIGGGPRLRPPPSGDWSHTKAWALSVAA